MKISISKNGYTSHVYSDDFKLNNLNHVITFRASTVEPLGKSWYADLTKINGPVLGPFERRDEAIKAEIEWIEANGL